MHGHDSKCFSLYCKQALWTFCLKAYLRPDLGLQFVPTRETFLESVSSPDCQGPKLMTAMRQFIDAFAPVLAEVQGFLASHGLDFQTLV